jgi:hypothetical protein
MDDALKLFHDNREIFVQLGIRMHFNIPKLHSLQHYRHSIEYFGTTDNYDTAYTERLHIDMTKNAYRASNSRDEFPQMTCWLSHREKVQNHNLFVTWRLSGHPDVRSFSRPSPITHASHIAMTQHPTHKAVSFSNIVDAYGAHDIKELLIKYILSQAHLDLTDAQVRNVVQTYMLPFNSVPVFHKVRFWLGDPQNREYTDDIEDVAHVQPAQFDARKRLVAGCFDTVLVDNLSEDLEPNNEVQYLVYKVCVPSFLILYIFDNNYVGFRIAQLHLVFQIPESSINGLFPNGYRPPIC